MELACPQNTWMVYIFITGYLFITIEHYTKINKATVAILMAVACWGLQFSNPSCLVGENVNHLNENLADISQIVLFLIGALTVVEIINQHQGFNIIYPYINFRSKKTMLWVVSIITFFLSGILDNLTTTVVMVTLLKRLVESREDRLLLGGAAVVAANAGGAWTPIGDVTTTMLWIGGQVSTTGIMKALLIPSLVCMVVSCFLLSLSLKGEFERKEISSKFKDVEPFGKLIFILGVLLLVFVPIFKVLTGLPPFMSMLLAMGILWLVTDLLHYKHEARNHLRVPSVLTKIDISSVLFFLGILLAVAALYSAGILTELATWLNTHLGSLPLISVAIGFTSAVIDNVPLVAATMGMYTIEKFPTDHTFWNMIAYCAGIGGSILVIGSAAGVVFMGMEKVDFHWYVRRISFSATVGFLAGFLAYLFFASL